MKIRSVKIQNRLYAFCIDLFIVVGLKIFTINSLAKYMNAFLYSFHRNLSESQIEKSLGFTMYALFPIFYLTYTTLSCYIWDSTIGTKTMGYHYGNDVHQQIERLTFKQCFQRSIINLCNIYSFGFLAIYSYFSKNKNIFSDIFSKSNAINDVNGIEYDLIVAENKFSNLSNDQNKAA